MFHQLQAPADLNRVTYDVYVAGEHVGSGKKTTYESIAGGSTASIESDINVDLSGSLGAAGGVIGDTLTGEQSYVRIEGKWHYNVGPASFSIPFEERSELQMKKNMQEFESKRTYMRIPSTVKTIPVIDATSTKVC